MPSIALLSDFGTLDPFAGEVRATVLRCAADVPCFDLSHGVPRGNIRSAAWMLASAWPHLPQDCVVCAMVDPGRGFQQNVLIAENCGKAVVTLDNGLVSLLHRLFPLRLFRANLATLYEQQSIVSGPCGTFLGRDVLAPLACQIALGFDPATIAEPTSAPTCILPRGAPSPVLHVDHYGNIVLDLHCSEYNSLHAATILQWPPLAGLGPLPDLRTPQFYGSRPSGEFLLYWGSSGFLEIALRDGNAALQLGIEN